MSQLIIMKFVFIDYTLTRSQD